VTVELRRDRLLVGGRRISRSPVRSDVFSFAHRNNVGEGRELHFGDMTSGGFEYVLPGGPYLGGTA